MLQEVVWLGSGMPGHPVWVRGLWGQSSPPWSFPPGNCLDVLALCSPPLHTHMYHEQGREDSGMMGLNWSRGNGQPKDQGYLVPVPSAGIQALALA